MVQVEALSTLASQFQRRQEKRRLSLFALSSFRVFIHSHHPSRPHEAAIASGPAHPIGRQVCPVPGRVENKIDLFVSCENEPSCDLGKNLELEFCRIFTYYTLIFYEICHVNVSTTT